jgi:hypothetical protein
MINWNDINPKHAFYAQFAAHRESDGHEFGARWNLIAGQGPTLPLSPSAFFAASASVVRCLINRRSFSAGAA